jgi:hypothetical protein
MPDHREQTKKFEADRETDRSVDPQDLVYSGGLIGNPREIVENPAVTPEMLNEPGDIRSDALDED